MLSRHFHLCSRRLFRRSTDHIYIGSEFIRELSHGDPCPHGHGADQIMPAGVSQLRKCVILRKHADLGAGFFALVDRSVGRGDIAKAFLHPESVFSQKIRLPLEGLELLIPKFGCIMYVKSKLPEFRLKPCDYLIDPFKSLFVHVSIPHSIEYMVSSITIADFSAALRSKTS